ncbi:LamG-like jellyroll fold domain-containing protein [Novipirellula aureliae]|nr:LamG-like jellyroll fold domain-containing protein [Novipirellula aureliae]
MRPSNRARQMKSLPSRFRCLRCERLETRLVLACPAEPFTILGTNGDDTILVEAVADSKTNVKITVNGVETASCRPLSTITVETLEGNDTITVAPEVYLPTVLDGGPGSDTINGGSGDDIFKVRDATLDTIDGGLGVNSAYTDSLDLVTGIDYLNPMPVTADNQTKHVKILVLNFEATIPSEGNKKLWEVFPWWNDPRELAQEYEKQVERASGGAIEFDIVQWRDLDELPAFEDGFRYDRDDYVSHWRTNSGWHEGQVDFPRIATEQSLVSLIDSGEVDEVWMMGLPYLAESWMAGPDAFFINGPIYSEIPTSRAFACMGFSYERGVDMMWHNTGHRTENHLNRVYGGWNLADPTSNWDLFSANYQQSNGVAGVGNTHYPANAESDYDTFNERVVQSWADDFLDYPNLTGATMPVNRYTWSKGPIHEYELSYQNWYFAHIPRADGTNPDGKVNNWWKYIYDFNNYTRDGQPKPLSASATANDVYNVGDTAYTFSVTYSGAIPVNIETLDGSDIRVNGPGGFSQLAQLVALSDSFNDTHVVATYRINAPSGTWSIDDRGQYTIQLQDGQVLNTMDEALPQSIVGSFAVRAASPVELVKDPDTSLLLHFDGNLNGADGETPTETEGNAFGTGVNGQGRVNAAGGLVRFEEAGNIDPLRGTIEMWIKPDWNGSTNQGTHKLFDSGEFFNNQIRFAVDGANNLIFYYAGDNTQTPAIENNIVYGTHHSVTDWVAGQWHHVAATWDSDTSEFQLYLDGKPVGWSYSPVNTVRINNLTGDTISLMGSVYGGNNAHATFDEYRISTRARSASEIQASYQAGLDTRTLTLGTPDVDLPIGGKQQLLVTSPDINGVEREMTNLVHWTSSNPNVVSVSASGEVLAMSTGSSTVAAKLDSVSVSATVNVAASSDPVGTFTVADVAAFGGTQYEISVTYSDETDVDVSSIGYGDMWATNDKGFSRFLDFVGVDNSTNGLARTATYVFTPVGGYWDSSDNGTYTVTLMPGQIFDTGRNSNRLAVSKTFQVKLPSANDPPTVSKIQPVASGNGRGSMMQVNFTSVDESDSHWCVIDWGDGDEAETIRLVDTEPFFIEHVYGAGGEYTVVLKMRNDQGSESDPRSIAVRVANSELQNPLMPWDVNRDGSILASDALAIINQLTEFPNGQSSMPVTAEDRGPDFLDANGDGVVSAADALYVINKLSERQKADAEVAEGETLIDSLLSDWIPFPTIEIESRIGRTETDPILANQKPTLLAKQKTYHAGDLASVPISSIDHDQSAREIAEALVRDRLLNSVVDGTLADEALSARHGLKRSSIGRLDALAK